MTNSQRFYGWTVAITLWCTFLLNMGLPYYGASVLNTAMGKALGFDKTLIGIGFSSATLVWGLAGPLVAFALNRGGLRITVTIGALINALAALLLGLIVDDGWLFVLVFGGVLGLGLAFSTNLPTQTGVTLWFSKRRALVMALVMTASGAGGFIGPPLLNAIIEHSDWQRAWLVVAGVCVACAALAWLLLRNRPGDLGQYPDGIAPTDASAAAHIGPRWRAGEALRRPAFWQILFAAIVSGTPIPLLVAHGILHLEELGHPAQVGAWAIGLMLLCSVPGRLLAGILCDRFAPRLVWAGMMLLSAGGVVLVIKANTQTEVGLFAVLLGLGFGGSIIAWVTATAKYFGPTSFATVMGMQTPIITPVAASMPALAGLLYDQTGTYSPLLWILAVAAVAGAGLIVLAQPPRPPEAASPTPSLA